ncbi:MAG: sigma-54-dependent Fis family transcriptional regulator [Planctomycetota bacterium]|nr:sigma-54-dependent Fis family transcriptional regulator [Planctomycetota bacterium]
MGLRMLVVDDEKISRVTRTRQLIESGYEAEGHETPFTALAAMDKASWDVVITDLRMPTMDGIQFLREIKSRGQDTTVIVISAYGTVRNAVEAMQLGAADFLPKPFDIEELKMRLKRVEEERRLRREVAALREFVGSSASYSGLIGNSPQMRRVFELIDQFALSPSNVLIIGETGTGKELVARAIHNKSTFSKGPFVAVACAAIPRELAESELFGHEPGSFTGASKLRRGRLELATGGTLFLDDVDDLPLELQGKFLRVLQERQFERVGGERTLTADMRLISATKVDLEKLVKSNRFREDLSFRLKVLVMRLPPLRERREDILLLARHFLETLAKERGGMAKVLSPMAAERLKLHTWPGNVRELRHAMEYAFSVSKGDRIEPGDLPINVIGLDTNCPFVLNLGAVEKIDLRSISEKFEGEIIRWALERAKGNQGKAAELLGLPRTTLLSKLDSIKTSMVAPKKSQPIPS